MNGASELLDRTFFTIGGTRVTLAGILAMVLIAAATLLVSWVVQRVIARASRLVGLNEGIWWAFKEKGIVIAFPQLDVHLDPEDLAAMRREGRGD